MIRRLCLALGVLLPVVTQAADPPSTPLVERYVIEGRLAEGATALTAHLKE